MVKSLHHRPLTRVGVRGRPPPSRDASEIFLTEGLGYKKIIMPMPMLSIILEKFTKYDTKTVFGLSFRCYFLRANDEYFYCVHFFMKGTKNMFNCDGENAGENNQISENCRF